MITDRKQHPKGNFFDLVKRALAAGIDLLQVREKDLPARELCGVVERALALARPHRTPVLVNDRFDVALCCGAQGVHLPASALPVAAVKRATLGKLIVGVSTHSLSEAHGAERAGADYILFGPVFETPSKLRYGPPLGLKALREVASKCELPVFALGGVDFTNFKEVLDNGARGIAGISLFIKSRNLDRDIQRIKATDL